MQRSWGMKDKDGQFAIYTGNHKSKYFGKIVQLKISGDCFFTAINPVTKENLASGYAKDFSVLPEYKQKKIKAEINRILKEAVKGTHYEYNS